MPETSLQECPICSAAPNRPCWAGRIQLDVVHSQRLKVEFGVWTKKYDLLHRDKTLRFDVAPYRRRK